MTLATDDFFKALADPTRLRLLMLLACEGELCVCELTHALTEIQPKVSRHLGLLRTAGLVQDRREGQWIFYRIHPQLPTWMGQVLEQTAQANRKAEPFATDLRKLRSMANRPGKACCA
ncbi:MAG: metalloregulator ArsR/SmtB family transcription factor [Xanthomonadaceae bacterium]|nr:metalloregulator ArsR/SmtB family transcription factor [Xanthomonadaceae bacterium]